MVLLGLSATPAAFAQSVLLDNTNNGTAALASGSGTTLDLSRRKGVLISVDPTKVLNLGSMKLGLQTITGAGHFTFEAAMYAWNGSSPTGAALATQQFNVSPTSTAS